ncbi:MAG: hypothetical protein PUP92_37445 [Rhizonema sp. PD38]|nr:hypothetical protein [Rhizonema sp. PD38]
MVSKRNKIPSRNTDRRRICAWEIIAIYAITDDLLTAIGHKDDIQCEMSDAEIITTALIAAIFFSGNHSKACAYMKDHKLVARMLEKSRFNRRLHRLSMLINDLFHQIGMILKETSDYTEYLLDSFPVPMCDPSGSPLAYGGKPSYSAGLTIFGSFMSN